MQQRFVGDSGLRASALGLGTMTWGSGIDEDVAADLLRIFCDAGGNLVDTSAGYTNGAAEAILGQHLGHTVARQDLVLVSKAGLEYRNGHRGVDTSRSAMLSSLDASLVRLGTPYLDLWLVDAWDPHVPLQETLSAMDLALNTGRVRYVGFSNFTGWQSAKAAVQAPFTAVAHQIEYSLLQRQAEAEVIPAAYDAGLGLLAWAPLGRGVLSGKYRGQIPTDSRAANEEWADYVEPYLATRPSRIVEALWTASQGLDSSPAQLALAWLLAQENVSSAIVGPRSAQQLQQLLGAEEVRLPEQISQVLSEVSERAN
ncbi:aldo/keto reductase [Pseudarthrobacter sp. J1738]|uniref:aldo/keto reductase n=1 Tax=Pseudarthrobacter sp. J1738 TaxID=3420446 RepID=UPI003D2957DB